MPRGGQAGDLNFFFQAEDGIRDLTVTGVQTCALPILRAVIFERLHAREVYLGCGFAFGHDREGNIELLRTVSQSLGFFADEVPELRLREIGRASCRERV